MIAWIGVALLAASWLDGLGYYHLAATSPWAPLVALGTIALTIGPARRIAPASAWTAALVVAPAIAIAQFPYIAAPILLCAGLLLAPLGGARRELGLLSSGPLAAGLVLGAQAVALEAYAAFTARSHELPARLVSAVSGVLGVLGIDRAIDGNTLALRSMRQTHHLAATWELLVDPVSVCFWAGGLALVTWRVVVARPTGRRWPHVLAGSLKLTLVLALWLPLRAGLLVALYLGDVLRLEHEAKLTSMQLFWSTGVYLGLLAPAIVLAWRFVPRPRAAASDAAGGDAIDADRGAGSIVRPLVAGSLAAAAAALATFALYWEPGGVRAAGRVLVEEVPANPQQVQRGGRPAVWEPTDRPFDTDWYGHKAGYNYWCIYDYLGKFYSTGRLTKLISPEALANCDVLILKVPVRAYAEQEIEAVVRFVERGGGLLLLGEHTNVYGTSEHLNAVSEHFGFQYRYDCLFGVDRVYEDRFVQPLVPHPIVQHFPEMDFATSCSIEPTDWRGRTVIRGLGLKNLGPEYHHDNFYPLAEDRPDMRFGAWVQLYATRFGAGRVVGFTDSTIFSNFCTFEPGKSELMLSMVEWLNGRTARDEATPAGDPRRWLWPLAAAALVGAFVAAWGGGDAILAVVGALALGWSLGVVGVRALHRASLPLPEVRTVVVEDKSPPADAAALSPGRSLKKGTGSEPFDESLARDADREVPVPFIQRAAGRSLKKGTGSEPFDESLARNADREVPVPLFQRAAGSPGPNGFADPALLDRLSSLPANKTQAKAKLVRVGFDTRWCKAIYPRSGFTDGNRDGFGIFERWFLRLGYFTRRYDDQRIFESDLAVLAYPNRSPSAADVERLQEYVAGGGHVLVLDSLDNPGSTTGQLLAPFGLSVESAPLEGLAYYFADRLARRLSPAARDAWASRRGQLTLPEGWPAIEVEGAIAVHGGEAWARLGERTVGATLRHGKGSVTVLGFATRFCDGQMGVTGDTIPGEPLRDVYEVQFELGRRILSGQSLFDPPAPRPRPPAAPDDDRDSPQVGEA